MRAYLTVNLEISDGALEALSEKTGEFELTEFSIQEFLESVVYGRFPLIAKYGVITEAHARVFKENEAD